MNEHISALSDGEFDEESGRRLLASLMRQSDARQELENCWLIGDALRAEAGPRFDISARVMAALQDEPVVLAPAAWASKSAPAANDAMKQPPAWMAMAAASCAVLVVAWAAVSLRPDVQSGAPSIANASQAPGVQTAALANNASASRTKQDEQSYLLAHQAYAGGAPMASVAGYIRTASDDQALSLAR